MNPFEENEQQPKLTPEEEAKVRRNLTILYSVMIIFIVAPFVAMYFFRK